MSEFKRSPSKVWWASESLEWREDSPRSQDSGFSDTEPSPTLQTHIRNTSEGIFKAVPADNLSANYQEKTTPDKSIRSQLESPKINRNLFGTRSVDGSGTAKTRSAGLNRSAPAVLDEVLNGNHSLSSDCESELECLFDGSPKHTSTPKARMRHARNKLPLSLYLKHQQERQLHPASATTENNNAVQTWMSEIRHHYQQECMMTLQSKSIAAELGLKVNRMAAHTTTNIRAILAQAECIQTEYGNLTSEKKHVGPLAQSLAGNIFAFLQSHGLETPTMTQQYDEIRKTSADQGAHLLAIYYTHWQSFLQAILKTEVKKLVAKLENPGSEMDLRATVTAVTSLCLRNEHLVDTFVDSNVVPALLILCEKCEGSSMRGLLFRALATVCCTAYAVRQFEQFSGIHIITDTLGEDLSRPEPERSEAVALLAQVTAPWIEDNHTIKGLEGHSRSLTKALTQFTSTTKCCQNLLLCTAALANMSTMDGQCLKHMLHQNTIEIVLEAVSKRGPCVSVYLLEQVATLIANMTSVESGREQLTKLKTVEALLYFLKVNNIGEEVEKRLQQKAIIALSRMCGEQGAAEQVVELGGVPKLVRLCREKGERFGSDAVLVAALATLRKVAEACGGHVISTEDAQELVEPKLLDSFLAYSSQSESYV